MLFLNSARREKLEKVDEILTEMLNEIEVKNTSFYEVMKMVLLIRGILYIKPEDKV